MKAIVLLLACISLSAVNADAQTPLGNGGLELWHQGFWSSDEPDSFTVGEYDGFTIRTTNAHSGLYAASIRPKYDQQFGFYWDGRLNARQLLKAPAAGISFWYQYHPEGHDSAWVNINTYSTPNVGGFLIGIGGISLNAATTSWQFAVIPIHYGGYSANDSKSIYIIFETGDSSGHVHPGTELLIDDVQIVSPTDVRDINCISLISLSPNPVSSTLTLHYKSPLPNIPITVSISNTAGQFMHSETFVRKGDKTDILLGDEVPPGVYTISVFGSGNSALYEGTFLKQ